MNTPTHTRPRSALPGLHERLTVLQAGPDDDRLAHTEQLARLLADGEHGPVGGLTVTRGAADLLDAAREAALRRIDEHELRRGELTSQLRRAEELGPQVTNRREEATARVRRMSDHLDECDELLERAGELTNAAEEARRQLDAHRRTADEAQEKLTLVEEQRAAAAQMIENAADQLRYLETAELDESALRRELEVAGHELRAAESARDQAAAVLREAEEAAAGRDATRQHIEHERGGLLARVQAPLPDMEPLREALDAYDTEAANADLDPVAQELAREWVDVESELDRITAALPEPPSPDQLAAAERRLQQIDARIAELQVQERHDGLDRGAREEIEAAHEAVLSAEELLDDPHAHDHALQQLEHARQVEQAVLRQHGYDTYLDVVLTDPEPGGDSQAELLDALRARRVAEDGLMQLRAAAEPPAILDALQARRDRVLREAMDLLGCDPGDSLVELLRDLPAVPPALTRALADELAELGYAPVGMSLREAAALVLDQHDDELELRDECEEAIARLDEELAGLDEDDARAASQQKVHADRAEAAMADAEEATDRVRLLEAELRGRASQDERRLQRIAAAEQLRSQIQAVTDALDESNEEYHDALATAERGVVTAEREVERATADLSDAVRRLQRIADALPPALRPRPGADPLAELPHLHETLVAEVSRAETALAAANDELARLHDEIERTQAELVRHDESPPSEDISEADLVQAVEDLVGDGVGPVVLDDPFTDVHQQRSELLEVLLECSQRRPVVLLTDDPDVLGWAIGLPPDRGTVTRLWSTPASDPAGDDRRLAMQPGPVA